MTNRLRTKILVAAVCCAGFLLAGVALSEARSLEQVEPKMVCMVNDTLFPREQIPVEVDGKTYFGCCEMCKGRLASDASLRSAKDPVSGVSVDKALAVIGAAPDGRVQYFLSEETFSRYNQGS
jgi:YHS domain-containing protein